MDTRFCDGDLVGVTSDSTLTHAVLSVEDQPVVERNQALASDVWWRRLTVLALACSVAMMFYFMGGSRLSLSWDENEYLNVAYKDAISYRSAGWKGLWHSWLYTEAYRLPAHRLVALPLILTNSVSLGSLRILSILLFLASAGMLSLAVRAVTTRRAGYFTALLFGASVVVVDSCRVYYTEPIQYLAIASTMYFLFQAAIGSTSRLWLWIGLGVSLGLGLLAKLSFPWIIGPMFLVYLVLAIFGRLPRMSLFGLLGAGILAALVAAPWYQLNVSNYILMARMSQHWDRMAIGGSTLQVVRSWIDGVENEVFGKPIAAMTVAALVISVFALMVSGLVQRRRIRSSGSAPLQRILGPAGAPVLMCVAGALPFPLVDLIVSVNHDARVISPAFLPAIAAVGLLIGRTPLLNWRLSVVPAAVALLWQMQSVLIPRNAFRLDAWNVEPVYLEASRRGLLAPQVGFIGFHWNFDPEALATPFLETGQVPDISLLWNSAKPWDATTVEQAAAAEDVLVIPPNYLGADMAFVKGDQENLHNAELDQWARQSGLFEAPKSFSVGRNDRLVYVNVYFKLKSPPATARSADDSSGKTR